MPAHRSGRRLLRRREPLGEVVGQLIQAGDLTGGSRPGGVDVVAGPDEADGVDTGLQGSADVAAEAATCRKEGPAILWVAV